LRQAGDEWLCRLETQQKSESTLVGYRVAIDDLPDWSETNGRDILTETAIVDHLHSYQQRAHPAEASYYRRFVLLRRFVRWVCRPDGVADPFLDLDAPPKPRQERDWLAPEEFRRLLDAAGHPKRNLPGLAEARPAHAAHPRPHEPTALRALRSRLARPRPRRPQAVPACPLREGRQAASPAHPYEPRASAAEAGQRSLPRADRSGLLWTPRRTTPGDDLRGHHRPRREAGRAREARHRGLVAEYLGHADLSTVARYAHVDRKELFEAAGRLEQLAAPVEEPAPPDIPGEPGDTGTRSDRPRRRRRRGRGRKRR